MRTRELSGSAALRELGARYDELCTDVDAPVTARRLWLETWASCYADHEPWLVLVEDGSDLVAAAALARRRRAGLTSVVGLGHGPSDAARLPARDNQAAARLAGAVTAGLRSLGGPWQLHLEQLPASDPVGTALDELLQVTELTAGDGMPMVEVGPERELRRHVSRNTRSAVSRARNRITDTGLDLALAWISDPAEIAAALPDVNAVHRARDVQLGRRSDLDDPRATQFHRNVIQQHADVGQVELLTLRLSGDLAAYVVAFADGRALRVWDNRVSPKYAHLSAGRIANAEAVTHVVTGDTYDVLDWMRGEEPYKLSSATTVVPTLELRAWSSTTAAVPHRVFRTARAVKSRSALLDKAWRATRRRVGQPNGKGVDEGGGL